MSTAVQGSGVFGGHGMGAVVEGLKTEIRELYLADNVPWIIGYSGGKDSTAVLQLVWLAIAEVLPGERHKTIHVITTDTGVENPVVAQWVVRSHAALSAAAQVQHMPVSHSWECSMGQRCHHAAQSCINAAAWSGTS